MKDDASSTPKKNKKSNNKKTQILSGLEHPKLRGYRAPSFRARFGTVGPMDVYLVSIPASVGCATIRCAAALYGARMLLVASLYDASVEIKSMLHGALNSGPAYSI